MLGAQGADGRAQDAFLALPGGFGTLDELFEMLTWSQIGLQAKPSALLNVDGFWDPLLAWVERAVEEGLLRPAHAKSADRRRSGQIAGSPRRLAGSGDAGAGLIPGGDE